LLLIVGSRANGFPLLLERHGGVLPDSQDTYPVTIPWLVQNRTHNTALRASRYVLAESTSNDRFRKTDLDCALAQ